MSGVRRFWSRREKSPLVRHALHDPQRPRDAASSVCLPIPSPLPVQACGPSPTPSGAGDDNGLPRSAHRNGRVRRRSSTPLSGIDPPLTLPTQPKPPEHFAGVFTEPPEPAPHNAPADKRAEKEHEKKVKAITERLRQYGVDNITEANIEYALQQVTPQGDAEAAFKLLWLLEDTYSGILRPYDPDTKLAGAVNKQGVSCYLDALLFSMFVRLDNFEAMLYDNYTDAKQKRLGALLRLWVNMLRSGRLITTDITAHIQQALADCGWADAIQHVQQDPSEAFTFITGLLELPMLTLKMDMFHTGKEDPQDDHKFINERLLEVAILEEPVEGRNAITLEDCLEHYFNNRIEVKRHLENQRRNTLKSGQSPPSFDDSIKSDKEPVMHVEVAEVPETPTAASPAVATPVTETPKTPAGALRPQLGRKRQDSIFSQRKVELHGVDPESLTKTDSHISSSELPGRKLSTRTEVLMPAWQFFKLLPWYTDNMPTSDAQVAAHFSRQRPILGICLKRYSCTTEGQARKRDDYVDIPLEIAVPNFVSGDELDSEGGKIEVGGNFRLVLQAVICHRGVSVHSGHYVCLCRSKTSSTSDRRGSAESEEPDEDPWMRFDDLASERISEINIHEALRKESPYLLFYQVQPIDEDGNSLHDHHLPSYTEATSRSQSDATPLEKPPYLDGPPASDPVLTHVMSDPLPPAPARSSTEVNDRAPSSARDSMDAPSQRGRPLPPNSLNPSADPTRRKSATLDTASTADTASLKTDPTNSLPSTPSEEKPNNSGFLNVAKGLTGSRRGSKVSNSMAAVTATARSRPTSTERAKRLSLNMTKLTQRMSKGQSAVPASNPSLPTEEAVPEIVPSEAVAKELAGQRPDVSTGGEQKTPAVEVEGVVIEPNEITDTRAPLPQPSLAPGKGGFESKREKKERKKAKAQAVHGHHGHGEKTAEERECAVM